MNRTISCISTSKTGELPFRGIEPPSGNQPRFPGKNHLVRSWSHFNAQTYTGFSSQPRLIGGVYQMGVHMDRSISPTELLQGTFAASPRVGQPNSGTAETSAPGNMGCLKLGDTPSGNVSEKLMGLFSLIHWMFHWVESLKFSYDSTGNYLTTMKHEVWCRC